MSILIVVLGLVTACSSYPSNDTIKNHVVGQIEMEGGRDVKFDLFEIVKIEPDEEGEFWHTEIRMKGTYTQHPHPYFNKTYNFNTTRVYEIYKDNKGGLRIFVVSMKKLYQAKGSYEVAQ